MKKIGLALSGGGFRASLYHLGLVRFLRDAGILPSVSHITSVSGGSIFSAHLVLNWDRYNGAPAEFDAAAREFLDFVRLDVRNRIVRRFPLNMPLRWPRRLLGMSNRKLTRTGLLEAHYEKYLYGDTSLFELPERPELHILATNLSEGCLCSFTRKGLLIVRRQPGHTVRLDHVHVGLATVAMAVTASSAFPGFFPPIELTGAEVGAMGGEFGRQTFTDGGVFDNLGVRMFRCLERPLLASSPLSQDDFFDLAMVSAALRECGASSADTPLRRLTQILVATRSQALLPPPGNGENMAQALPAPADAALVSQDDLLLASLGDVLRHYQFNGDPLFATLSPADPDAHALLQSSRLGNRALSANDQAWLNRHLLEVVFRQATGQPCFRRLNSGLDSVLVSDSGKPFEIRGEQRSVGLLRTFLRSSDILMDRVWQLECETFKDVPGFVFARVTDVVEPEDDATALHPEIQQHAANIRTDLDCFSPLEISSLVRHGYCVGRKACRQHPELFGDRLPADAPWDPIPEPRSPALIDPGARRAQGPPPEPAENTVEARSLQASSGRRIGSRVLDYRDWVSYLYVPILVPILFLLPYFIFKSYQRSHRLSQLIDSLSQKSPDLALMSQLLDGPMKPWSNTTAEEVLKLEPLDYKGYEVLQDSRIIDMRAWKPPQSTQRDSNSMVFGYRRLKVRKLPESTGNNTFRFSFLTTHPAAQIRFPPQLLEPKLYMNYVPSGEGGEKKCNWEGRVDMAKVPPGDYVDILYEHLSPGEFLVSRDGSTSVAFHTKMDTAEATRWYLMPEGKEYRSFQIVRYQTDKPETVEPVRVVTEYLSEDSSILAYKLMSLKAGYTYEHMWYYK